MLDSGVELLIATSQYEKLWAPKTDEEPGSACETGSTSLGLDSCRVHLIRNKHGILMKSTHLDAFDRRIFYVILR